MIFSISSVECHIVDILGRNECSLDISVVFKTLARWRCVSLSHITRKMASSGGNQICSEICEFWLQR